MWSWFSFAIGVVVGIPVTCGIFAVLVCMSSGVLSNNKPKTEIEGIELSECVTSDAITAKVKMGDDKSKPNDLV